MMFQGGNTDNILRNIRFLGRGTETRGSWVHNQWFVLVRENIFSHQKRDQGISSPATELLQ